jgi:hypothetical protein
MFFFVPVFAEMKYLNAYLEKKIFLFIFVRQLIVSSLKYLVVLQNKNITF